MTAQMSILQVQRHVLVANTHETSSSNLRRILLPAEQASPAQI